MTEASKDEGLAPTVTLEAWLVTDVGVVRDHNEDSAYMDPSHEFFVVADGMGGHAAGEVASAMAVETVQKTLEAARADIAAFAKEPGDNGRRGLVQLLQNAVLQAHQAVFQRGQAEPDKAGMGTTLDVVLVAGPEAFVAHVGDSRTYLVRGGKSSQITTDHTVAEVLVIEGKLTIEEAAVSPLRTILVNAIGVSADVGVEMAHVTLKRGDRILLCSDGLHDYFPVEEEIAQRLSSETPGEALKELVELAKTRGGHDNITGVLVNVVDVAEGLPAHTKDEPTHPVDLGVGNPFIGDEPTQTAAQAVGPAANSLRETQPMRSMDVELETAPTIPPPMQGRKGNKDSGRARTDPHGQAAVKTDGKPDAKPDDDASAVPQEQIQTADTGKVERPKKD